jgi:23S rRNA pseudouridine1911/1915/1917 synthase
MIEGGRVSVDDRVITSRARRVRAGERLTISGPPAPVAAAPPAAEPGLHVPVVWSDDNVIVVDKPAGVVVHPGAGNRSGTLVQGLLARFPDLADLAMVPNQLGDGGQPADRERPGIVHRLDKGTSGLLMVARTPSARAALTSQLAARQVGRQYVALVAGTVEADEGLIDAPLGRATGDPTRIRVQAAGRPARTRYRVEARYDQPRAATRLRCQLETGRTHQIRVHLATIGHPVVGDERYGGRVLAGWRPLAGGRQFLHAAWLAFDHPVTGERLSFSSPLPPDLQEVLDMIGPPAGG